MIATPHADALTLTLTLPAATAELLADRAQQDGVAVVALAQALLSAALVRGEGPALAGRVMLRAELAALTTADAAHDNRQLRTALAEARRVVAVIADALEKLARQ